MPAEQRTSSVAIGPSAIVVVPVGQLEPLDRHPARPQLGLLAVTRQLVRLAAGDAHRRVVGRHLLDRRRGSRRALPRPARAWVAGARSASARRRGRRSSSGRRSRPARGIPSRQPGGTRPARVAWPRKTGSTPAANGSSVPPWPTRRTPVSRRTSADDVVRRRARRLGDDEDAVEARRSPCDAAGSAPSADVASSSTSSREPRRGRPGRACSSGRSTVAPAARAWPPPPNAPVSTVASTPPSRVRTLILRALARSAGTGSSTLGRVRLAEQVDQPLGVRRPRAGRGVVRLVAGWPTRAVRRASESSVPSTRPNSLQLAVGLGAVDAAARCRAAARRRRPARRRRAACAASCWDAGSWPCR